jgi:glutathione S-transferase
MSELVLHHYPESPYADKIRRVLGFKGLPWLSVRIPIVAPKPDLVALTGGYRKTPVLQIGADVYCDTDCIAREIERRHAEPTLHPTGSGALGEMLSGWQQELFSLAIEQLIVASGELAAGFFEDRATMFEGGIDLERSLREMPAHRDQLRSRLALLEAQLSDGRPYSLGAECSLADFSLSHPLFALRDHGPAGWLEPCPRISEWLQRIDAFGQGSPREIDADRALAIAREASPTTRPREDPADPNGRKPGDRLRIVHRDFGLDPVIGELVASSPQEIALRRSDDRIGDVIVHFPRQYYLVLPAT